MVMKIKEFSGNITNTIINCMYSFASPFIHILLFTLLHIGKTIDTEIKYHTNVSNIDLLSFIKMKRRMR